MQVGNVDLACADFLAGPLKPKPALLILSASPNRWLPRRPCGPRDSRRAPVVSGVSYPSCSLEDLAMRTYDFSPLFRSTIGFDRLFDLVETAQRATEESYPPYNIERLAEDRYQISLAVAGFSPDEVSVTAEQNVVTIEGDKTEKAESRVPVQGHLDPALQAAIQPRRLRAGEECDLRQRAAHDRTGAGDPRSHEAAADRHQRRVNRRQRPSDRGEGGLINLREICRASLDARHPSSSMNGGDHAADDRLR